MKAWRTRTGGTPLLPAFVLLYSAMTSACMHRPELEPESRAPRLVSAPVIRYPAMLRRANVEGDVVVDVVIDSAGHADWSRTVVRTEAHAIFTLAVRNGYASASWSPATVSGLPTTATWRDTIEFRLQDDTIPCEPPRGHHRRVCAAAEVVRRISLPTTIEEVARPSPAGPGMPDAGRQRWRDSLHAGRARWLRTAPRSYRVEIAARCWCTWMRGTVRTVVSVRDGRLVRERHILPSHEATAPSGQGWLTWTVDSLFAAADRELDTNGRVVDRLELDPQYGFPRRLYSDVPFASDSWRHLEVLAFIPISATASSSPR